MSATEFWEEATGATAQEAFDAAVAQAKYDYGHRGYTGTIAEKTEFVIVEAEEDIGAQVERMINDDEVTKWGPAGCIQIGDNEWLFFGWASA